MQIRRPLPVDSGRFRPIPADSGATGVSGSTQFSSRVYWTWCVRIRNSRPELDLLSIFLVYFFSFSLALKSVTQNECV